MEFTYNIKENKKTNKDIDNNLSRCFRPFGSRVMVLSIKCDSPALQTWVTWRMRNYCGRGARNPNLQDVVRHASHVCSLYNRIPRTNGMHLTQFYHARLDLLSLVIDYVCFVHLSRETYVNHSRGAKVVWLSIVVARISVTFGYY